MTHLIERRPVGKKLIVEKILILSVAVAFSLNSSFPLWAEEQGSVATPDGATNPGIPTVSVDAAQPATTPGSQVQVAVPPSLAEMDQALLSPPEAPTEVRREPEPSPETARTTPGTVTTTVDSPVGPLIKKQIYGTIQEVRNHEFTGQTRVVLGWEKLYMPNDLENPIQTTRYFYGNRRGDDPTRPWYAGTGTQTTIDPGAGITIRYTDARLRGGITYREVDFIDRGFALGLYDIPPPSYRHIVMTGEPRVRTHRASGLILSIAGFIPNATVRRLQRRHGLGDVNHFVINALFGEIRFSKRTT